MIGGMNDLHDPAPDPTSAPGEAPDWRAVAPDDTPRRELPLIHQWRLVRSRDGVLGGVCAGLARAAGIDVVVVRIGFVVAALSGLGLVAYVALLILSPREEPEAGTPVELAPLETARLIRVVLAIGAVIGVTSALGDWPYDGFPLQGAGGTLGLMLIAAGAAVLLSRRGYRLGDLLRPPPGSAHPQPAPPAAPGPAAGPSAPSAPDLRKTPWPPSDGDLPTDPLRTDPLRTDPLRDGPVVDRGGARRTLRERVLQRSWGVIATRFLAAICAVLGSLTMLTLIVLDGSGALSVGAPALIGVLLVAGTVGVIATSAIAPPVWPTLVAVLVLAAGGALAGATSDWQGHVGDRDVVITRADQLADRYDLAIGALTLDLSQLQLDAPDAGEPAGDVTIGVRAGIGRVDVIVPDDVQLVAEAEVSIGEVHVPRDATSGLSVEAAVDDSGAMHGVVRLELDGGIGEIAVCRAADAEDGGRRCAA
jgi:phage shock protein PspC (stress-responsive transcriptional regulator)